mgnify:CR=1 FL=1|jgi:hypothetical protein
MSSRHVRRRSREGAAHGPTVQARLQGAEEAIINLVGALEHPEAQLSRIDAATRAVREDLTSFELEMRVMIRVAFEKLGESVDCEDAAEQSTCFRLMDDMQNDKEDGQNMLRRVQKIDAATQALAEELGVVEDIDQEDY